MPKFLLILRGDPDEWRHQPPVQVQQLIERFETWAGRLMGERRFLDGKKLADGEGRVLTREGEIVRVTDGPYGETKEIVGGVHEIRRLDPMGAVE